MPKLKPSTNERLNRLFVGTMDKYQKVEAITDEQLAKKVGVTVRTIQNWRNNPEHIELCKLRIICKTLHIPSNEILEFL